MLLGLLVAACAPAQGVPGTGGSTDTPAAAPTQESPTTEPTSPPTEQPTGQPTEGQYAQAEQAAVKALTEELGTGADQVKVVRVEAVEWPDSCLGIVRIDALCAQGIVPGFRIILEANGTEYEYHTNADGSEVVKSPLPEADAPVEAAQATLAQALGIEPAEIEVVTSRPVEWPNACLGASLPGRMCAEVVTPGYLIILKAGEKEYEYHTNADGSVIQPGEVELSWHREGGIAGFCDDLVVFTTGEIQAAQCGGSGQARNSSLNEALSTEELAQYHAWLEKFDSVTIEMGDEAVADAMKVSLFLKGRGSGQPTEAEQQELLAWAQALYTKLNATDR
jgi:hypothetical protein